MTRPMTNMGQIVAAISQYFPFQSRKGISLTGRSDMTFDYLKSIPPIEISSIINDRQNGHPVSNPALTPTRERATTRADTGAETGTGQNDGTASDAPAAT